LPTQRDTSLRLPPSRKTQEKPERLSFSGAEKEGAFVAISDEPMACKTEGGRKVDLFKGRAEEEARLSGVVRGQISLQVKPQKTDMIP
jgi:hypothetical protein